MLVRPLSHIIKLEYSKYSRYNQQSIFNHLHGCKSFENVLYLCKHSIKAQQKINGVILSVENIDRIVDDWTQISKHIFQLVTRKKDEDQMCIHCRQVIQSQKYDNFRQLLQLLKDTSHLFKNNFLLAGFNLNLKKTFTQLYILISKKCSGWKYLKGNYERIIRNQIQFVEQSIAPILALQQIREKKQAQQGQVKQQVLLLKPQPSSHQEETVSRFAPSISYQQIFSRPEKKSTQKKRKQ